ncbi:MAG: aminotransferase class I/II-fold pyridoxal phosphate-dependent enzyme [Chloroflexota bacterium]|nr:aminotransferase class I/II-fold pyridoxal phosphate-dependent enzyme [Chloroflexota bacterium]
MARTPASRIQRVQPPATLAAGEKARQLARQGHDIVDLGQSSPHHVTPGHIVEAGIRALNQGLTNISSSRGLPELRQALAHKLAAHNDRAVDPEGDILVTPGSKMGLYDAINAYIERGDEVLVIEPTWVSFSQQVEMAEGISVAVPLSEEEEYYINYEHLREYVTPQSKMLIINNPNNPTGRVYTQEELEAVARVAIENDLLVVCDETYEYFTYDGNSHITVANLEGMAERTLTSYTFTKAYSMAGWRLGCIVAQSELLEPLLKIQEQTSSFVSPFVQVAGVAALQGPQDHLTQWREDCNELRIRCADRLYQVPGVHCPLPDGATFLFPRYSADMTSAALAELLVEREGVVVTPGAGFGESGEGHFRIALMRSPADRVLEGVERIARVLESL